MTEATFAGRHPTLRELADLLHGGSGDVLHRGEAVRAHVQSCVTCRRGLAGATSLPELQPDDIHVNVVEPGGPPAGVVALRRQATPDPQLGQLWRFRWEATADVGVILTIDGAWLVVAPVGEDPAYAEPGTVTVDSSGPLGAPFTVWPQLRARVPTAALDVHLGELSATAWKEASYPQTESTSFDQQTLYKEALKERWSILADAASAALPDSVDAARLSLRDALEGAGHTFDELEAALGVQAALSLWRADRSPSQDEMAIIRDRFGDLPGQPFGAPPVPYGLVVLLSHPRYRARIQRKAAARSAPEAAVRREILAAVASGRAARVTGRAAERGTEEQKWAALIEHELGDL